MNFNVKNINLENDYSDCIIVGIFEKNNLSITATKIDKISNGYISKLLLDGEIKGKIGDALLLYNVPNLIYKRIILVGCGNKDKLYQYQYKKIILKAINTLTSTISIKANIFLTELSVENYNTYWKIRQILEIIEESLYNFDILNNIKKKIDQKLNEITLHVSQNEELINGKNAIKHGSAISLGKKSTKDLGNLPPNICNSSYLISQIHKITKNYSNINNKNINEQEMQKLGMNAYLAVGKGSPNQSIMSIIEYKISNSNNICPIVFIGKGVTFDSGGISIKPSNNMEEMKYDMCGAAVVYGLMQIIAELKLPLYVIGILANCENLVDGLSYRPGDVLTTLSGKTVEIVNTDAEGRLILCDVLTYVERFNPEIVIDIATLTGACVVALGNNITGLMSNCDSLAKELINASEQTNDYVWRLPLLREFKEQLKSNVADIKNVGGYQGGAITAGYFLSYFSSKYKWAHLDIAGTAYSSHGQNKYSTGRPLSMLSQFLINHSKKNY